MPSEAKFSGANLLKASYLPEDGDTPGGFAGVFGKIAQSYFQRHGDHALDFVGREAYVKQREVFGSPLAIRQVVGTSAGALSAGSFREILRRDREPDDARRRIVGHHPLGHPELAFGGEEKVAGDVRADRGHAGQGRRRHARLSGG